MPNLIVALGMSVPASGVPGTYLSSAWAICGTAIAKTVTASSPNLARPLPRLGPAPLDGIECIPVSPDSPGMAPLQSLRPVKAGVFRHAHSWVGQDNATLVPP